MKSNAVSFSDRHKRRPFTIAFVASYPPRECGIATFTQDLAQAMSDGADIAIAAINAPGETYRYRRQVRWRIDQGRPETYAEVGRELANAADVDAVLIQHEFGLYGRWDNGLVADYLPSLLEQVYGRKPMWITLHTVLPHPQESIRQAVATYAEMSDGLVTMVNLAGFILSQDYEIDSSRVRVIPHGVPQIVPLSRMEVAGLKSSLGLAGRTILSTFGLIRNSKGLEYAIQAMPDIVARHPEAVYLIVGETHPEVRRHEGESYRNRLMEMVNELGLTDHVRFVNEYLEKRDLVQYLQISDVYLTPYLDRNQITSGTLAYALGCGRAAVSTPYLYATEALAEHRGLWVEFASAGSISRTVLQILDNPALKLQLQREAYRYGRQMAWPVVGRQYLGLLGQEPVEPVPSAVARSTRVDGHARTMPDSTNLAAIRRGGRRTA